VKVLNLRSSREGGDPVFTPTIKTLESMSVISTTVVSDETDFGIVIDHLYFLLYEGSGAAKRLVAIAPRALLEPLWMLKHLRTDARHDIEHGDSADILKKRDQIAGAFRQLIDKPVPTSDSDWGSAQLGVYEVLAEMLQRVCDERDAGSR
jgi:hypothetical protein